jgi:hypothetical protein
MGDALTLPGRETRVAARGEPIDLGVGERAAGADEGWPPRDALDGPDALSADLLRKRYPKAAIESVALCIRDDEKLRPLLKPTLAAVWSAPLSALARAEGALDDQVVPRR